MRRLYLAIPDRPALAEALAARGLVVARDPAPDDACRLGLLEPGAAPGAALAALGISGEAALALLVRGGERDQLAAIDAALPAEQSDALIAAQLAALVRSRQPGRRIVIGDLVIDPIERRVWRGGAEVELLPREYRLLIELARAPGVTVSRQVLLERVCGLQFEPGTNVLEVHVSRLRAKLDRGFEVPLLHTEKGQGYRLSADGGTIEPVRATG